MKTNRTRPQFDNPTFEKPETQEKDCCNCRCTRRAACISGIILSGLIFSALAVGFLLGFGIPERPSINRDCRTQQNGSGFLCDDRVTCIPPSDICDGAPNCPSGTDEDKLICSDLPNNLPSNLIFRCGNPHFWIFIDKKCNYINDCGDCSDETGIYASCLSCGVEWWPCTPVEFQYCDCIPRSLCRDGRQHCFDWSDEYICIKD